MFWCALLLLILMGVPYTSCTLVSVSFLRLGKFSAIISLIKPSAPLSLSSSSGTPIIRMLLHLMESLSSLNLYSWSSIFFLSSFQLLFDNFIFYIIYLFLCFFHPCGPYIQVFLHLSYCIFYFSLTRFYVFYLCSKGFSGVF